MDALLGLITPIALIPLFILAGGIILYVLVALGGWGERTLTSDAKAGLGFLGTILTLIGILGIILVVYPVVRPNVIMIQQDLNLPNPLSTPIPQPTPTPLSPKEQARKDTEELIANIFMIVMGIAMVIFVLSLAIGGARMMWNMSSDLIFPPFGLPRLPRLPKRKVTKVPTESRSVTYRPKDKE